MGEGRTSGSKSRTTDAVVISLFVIVVGIVVFAIALAAPWMGAPGNSAGLCAERAPWGTPENLTSDGRRPRLRAKRVLRQRCRP
ncbi:hypothetical protein [Rhodococcus sp. IEGM 1318]|uniref:hypothetical protein n=1 Tax=Rhodococcus sp. IEGM 1318 TaxID=3082226 RepID=UPI002955B244|nr:hypothetical protein [Rhodococcus sp. IEGM 1318]MDV8007028.1 hypothetical protein [Rhodococcus sp. IEGM 1318]